MAKQNGRLKLRHMQRIDDGNMLDLYIYGDVGDFDAQPDEYGFYEDAVTDKYFKDILGRYPDVQNINLYINSAGGSVKDGYGIYAQLKRHPAHKTVYIDGFANSIASIIAMVGDHIVMQNSSMMGVHNAMDFCYGNAEAHRKVAEDLDRLMEGNRQVYLTRSNGKISEQVLIDLLNEETMLTAQECLQYGFCDEIVGQIDVPEGIYTLKGDYKQMDPMETALVAAEVAEEEAEKAEEALEATEEAAQAAEDALNDATNAETQEEIDEAVEEVVDAATDAVAEASAAAEAAATAIEAVEEAEKAAAEAPAEEQAEAKEAVVSAEEAANIAVTAAEEAAEIADEAEKIAEEAVQLMQKVTQRILMQAKFRKALKQAFKLHSRQKRTVQRKKVREGHAQENARKFTGRKITSRESYARKVTDRMKKF